MSKIETKYDKAVAGIKSEWFTDSSTNWYDYICNLEDGSRVVYLITILQHQVYNGGLHQYFFNGYGQFVIETIEALNQISAPKKASLLNSAFDCIMDVEYMTLPEFRHRVVFGKMERTTLSSKKLARLLDDLDDVYYSLENEENEFKLLESYLGRVLD